MVTTSAPEPSGAGSGGVSQPRAVTRSAACWNCGSGDARATASLPSTWECPWIVSQVALHSSNGKAGQPEGMEPRYRYPPNVAGVEHEPLSPGQAPRDPEELDAPGVRADAQISPQTRPGPVHLTVADLERSLSYYRSEIGLDALEQTDGRATVGAGTRELLVLVEEAGARPAHGFTGLYHFALLVPERHDLARWLAHAARDRVRLVGLSDHFVSEAIYLSDPDGHGIEIYWDRPRDVWEGKVDARMTTLPLDVAEPPRRARRSRDRAVRRATRRNCHGARAPQGRLDPGDGRLLP